ncbi:MAG: hypothetical protein ACYS30_10575 [Planctomycetota bacterium]
MAIPITLRNSTASKTTPAAASISPPTRNTRDKTPLPQRMRIKSRPGRLGRSVTAAVSSGLSVSCSSANCCLAAFRPRMRTSNAPLKRSCSSPPGSAEDGKTDQYASGIVRVCPGACCSACWSIDVRILRALAPRRTAPARVRDSVSRTAASRVAKGRKSGALVASSINEAPKRPIPRSDSRRARGRQNSGDLAHSCQSSTETPKEWM